MTSLDDILLEDSESSGTDDPCAEIEAQQEAERAYLTERFYLCVVGGGSVALVGMLCTAFLLRIFVRSAFQTPRSIYPAALAILDSAILINYVLLIGVGIAKDYVGSMHLHEMWHMYVRPMFCLGRITQASQTYVIAAQIIDRFALAACKRNFNGVNRSAFIVLLLMFTTASKVTSYWEVTVHRNDSCSGFAVLHVAAASTGFVVHPAYIFYKFYIDPVLHVYIPFTTMLVLNVGIVYKLKTASGRKTATHTTVSRSVSTERARKRKEVRDATLTTVAIVMCYLVANMLHFPMTLLEQTHSKVLEQYFKEYTLASDVSSCLVILTVALRLPIYFVCNQAVRNDIIATCTGCSNRRTMLNQTPALGKHQLLVLKMSTEVDSDDKTYVFQNPNNYAACEPHTR